MKHWSERPLDKRKEDLSEQVYQALIQTEKRREEMNKEFNSAVNNSKDGDC